MNAAAVAIELLKLAASLSTLVATIVSHWLATGSGTAAERATVESILPQRSESAAAAESIP